MVSRAAIIEMLAGHRAKGDKARQKEIAQDLGKLSTELLRQFLDDQELEELEKGEGARDASICRLGLGDW